jgi:flagellar hook-associated protein 2
VGLRFDASGGQLNQALKAIVEAERQPIQQLEARKGREEQKMKLFQEFKGRFANFDRTLAELSDFNRFKEYKVDLGDGADHLAVTIDKEKVQPGSHEIEIVSLAKRSSVISKGFEDPNAAVFGVGYVVTYNGKGEKEEIYVESKNSSLNGIANAINRKRDSSVKASVIKDDSNPDNPWRLIISSKKDGLDDEVKFPQFYFLDGRKDLRISKNNEAGNAVLKIDGFEIETSGNKITDFLPGLNLDLKQAKEGQSFTISISEDTEKIAGKLKGMVDQVNGILDFINKQNSVDANTDTSKSFAGDTSLQSIEYRLRNLIHEGFPVWDNPDNPDKPRMVFLNQLGVTFEKNGQMSYSDEKFRKALGDDFNGVSEAITGEYGFARQIRSVVTNYTRPGNGLLATRESSLRNRISRIDRDIETKERLVQRKTDSLVQQFSRLQSTMQSMQSQQQYLQASMASGGGMISQLMGG